MESTFTSRDTTVVIGSPLKLVITSTTGTAIRDGMTSVLTAKVINVKTDQYEPSENFTFKWQRNEKPTEFIPVESDTLTITYADLVGGNATFTCVASSAAWTGSSFILMSENASGWSTARLILYRRVAGDPGLYNGGDIEYTFYDDSYKALDPEGFGDWNPTQPSNADQPMFAIYQNVQTQDANVVAYKDKWSKPEMITAESQKGIKIQSPSAVFNTSSRGYVVKDKDIRFECRISNVPQKKVEWTVLPSDPYLIVDAPEGDNNEFLTIHIKRKYNGDTIRVNASIPDEKLSDQLNLVSNAPVGRYCDLGVKPIENDIDLPNNSNIADDPFVVPNEGPLDNFDYFTRVKSTGETVEGKPKFIQSVLYFKITNPVTREGSWNLIDNLEDDPDFNALNNNSLRGEMALSGLQGLKTNPSTIYDGSYMNLFVNNLVANYIAANAIDAREYYVLPGGCIYGGKGYKADGSENILEDPNKPGTFYQPQGFHLSAEGALQAVSAVLKKAEIYGSVDFRDEQGIIFKTQKKSNPIKQPCSPPDRWGIRSLWDKLKTGEIKTCHFDNAPSNNTVVTLKRQNKFRFASLFLPTNGDGTYGFKVFINGRFAITLADGAPGDNWGDIKCEVFINGNKSFDAYDAKTYYFNAKKGDNVEVKYVSFFAGWSSIDFDWVSDIDCMMFNSTKNTLQSQVTEGWEYWVEQIFEDKDVTYSTHLVVFDKGEFGPYMFDSNNYILYAPVDEWMKPCTEQGGILNTDPSLKVTVDGVEKSPVSVVREGEIFVMKFSDGTAKRMSITKDPNNPSYKGWYRISGTYGVLQATRGNVTSSLIPATVGGVYIGLDSNKFAGVYSDYIYGDKIKNKQNGGSEVWGAVFN